MRKFWNLSFSSYMQLQYIEKLRNEKLKVQRISMFRSVEIKTPNELYYLIMLVAVSFYLSISLKGLPKG